MTTGRINQVACRAPLGRRTLPPHRAEGEYAATPAKLAAPPTARRHSHPTRSRPKREAARGEPKTPRAAARACAKRCFIGRTRPPAARDSRKSARADKARARRRKPITTRASLRKKRPNSRRTSRDQQSVHSVTRSTRWRRAARSGSRPESERPPTPPRLETGRARARRTVRGSRERPKRRTDTIRSGRCGHARAMVCRVTTPQESREPGGHPAPEAPRPLHASICTERLRPIAKPFTQPTCPRARGARPHAPTHSCVAHVLAERPRPPRSEPQGHAVPRASGPSTSVEEARRRVAGRACAS